MHGDPLYTEQDLEKILRHSSMSSYIFNALIEIEKFANGDLNEL